MSQMMIKSVSQALSNEWLHASTFHFKPMLMTCTSQLVPLLSEDNQIPWPDEEAFFSETLLPQLTWTLRRIILKTNDLELKIEKEGREIMNQLKLDNMQWLKRNQE